MFIFTVSLPATVSWGLYTISRILMIWLTVNRHRQT
ncbi:MAG: hypothetical protein J07HQX50_01681, partial [Haloquadratum sp. J07HQX50]